MPKFRRRWVVAFCTIPLFGMVAAFGIAPHTQTGPVPLRTVIEELRLAQQQPESAPPAEFWREERIRRGDTIASLLARLDVNRSEAFSLLRNIKELKPLRQLKPGKTVQAITSDAGELLSLSYANSNDGIFVAEKNGGRFKFNELPLMLERRSVMQSAEIKSSLFAATDAVELPDSIAMQIVDIFSSDIDFHRDLRKDDRFSVVYEMYYDAGKPVKSGRVLAAEFTNQGKNYQALYFQDEQGRGGYYTPKGNNLRKAFLRSPLEFSRITSGFSYSRFHPLLMEWRAHRGTDYAAPSGTRVKATANGITTIVGRQGGYGNVVILQHQGKYSTVYGHLSGFAAGLHHGLKVKQGDVIGYVGMTGLATGPHLHYEFRINGEQHDPSHVAVPEGPPITPQLKPAFDAAVEPLISQLALARGTHFVKLD
jgi:murein DD-endopeptidase MepM/ murein hydrolase activator NlpD